MTAITHDGAFSIKDVFSSAIICKAFNIEPKNILRINKNKIEPNVGSNVFIWGIKGSRYYTDYSKAGKPTSMIIRLWNDLWSKVYDDKFDIYDQLIFPIENKPGMFRRNPIFAELFNIIDNQSPKGYNDFFIKASVEAIHILDYMIESNNKIIKERMSADILFNTATDGILIVKGSFTNFHICRNYKNVRFIIHQETPGEYILDTVLCNSRKSTRNIFISKNEYTKISKDGNTAIFNSISAAKEVATKSIAFNNRYNAY